MSDQKTDTIILIKKKKAAHGAHHGGAWKVAYADFVTAMMSLFIVLWLTSSTEAVKKSIAAYFNDPHGTSVLPGTSLNGSGESLPLARDGMEKLKQQLLQAARTLPDFNKIKKQVEIVLAPDGLRVELKEDEGGTFFRSGSPEPTPALRELLQAISPELGRMQNHISIEGHTDSVPYNDDSSYTNWELSVDRANAARRLMQSSGVKPGQVEEVRGFADHLPRIPGAPADSSNRRITLVVKPVDLDGPPTAGDTSASSDAAPEAQDIRATSSPTRVVSSGAQVAQVAADKVGRAPAAALSGIGIRERIWQTFQSFHNLKTTWRLPGSVKR